MFRNIIRETELTSEIADEVFSTIYGDDFNGDCSFVSTLRALVYPRMNGEKLRLCFTSSAYSLDQINTNKKENIIKAICSTAVAKNPGVIQVHDFRGFQDGNLACMDLINNEFEKYNKGWYKLEKVTSFYRKSFTVIAFINPGIRSVWLFVDSLDYKKLHYLQCAIVALMPWYFDPQKGISEIEMRLINSLREKTSEKYEACIKEISLEYDFREVKIRKYLKGFEIKVEKELLSSISNEINNIDYKIIEYNNKISNLLEQKSERNIKLLGLETKIGKYDDEKDSEIMNYFLCNRNIELRNVDGQNIQFVCAGYLTYFDEDMALSVIRNEHSYVYSYGDEPYGGKVNKNDMEKLMRAIFIDQVARIKVCAAYSFSIGRNVNPINNYNFGDNYNDYLPNPHIDRYACMGDYSATINQLLMNNDYVGAIEQCMASCKSLNFADSTVMRAFMKNMYSSQRKFIELPNGEMVTSQDAVEWLKQEFIKNNEKEENKNE